ncbi:helix-turn-helix transcriptional regulator [Palleronia abyssalis]|uniref:Arabinose operon regulatory protein n=1 Tax=Palleronia abyssalis TaxID=1501240 RepID=A0A2R8BQD4_9RHOB|nr:AraC family transcriptional regulator [Palleronia abyssalis]SPJ22341.1 Arabinose operon regulatory protein [Palleronia abyssalis]
MLDLPRPEAGLRIVPLHRLCAGGRWRTEAMRSYGQAVLYWFIRGQGRVTVQGITRGYGAHNAVLLPPGTMHGFDTAGTVQGHAVFLPKDAEPDMPSIPLHLRLRDVQPQAELTFHIEAMRAELERGANTSEVALTHHVGLLTVWLSRQAGEAWTRDEDLTSTPGESLASAYTSLLERYFRDGHGVADYARALGVTPAHLTRCCRQTSGRAASDLLHDRLHFEACRLLGETRMPVKAVAETLGFRSSAYFTRAFRARAGMTPSQFRRRA